MDSSDDEGFPSINDIFTKSIPAAEKIKAAPSKASTSKASSLRRKPSNDIDILDFDLVHKLTPIKKAKKEAVKEVRKPLSKEKEKSNYFDDLSMNKLQQICLGEAVFAKRKTKSNVYECGFIAQFDLITKKHKVYFPLSDATAMLEKSQIVRRFDSDIMNIKIEPLTEFPVFELEDLKMNDILGTHVFPKLEEKFQAKKLNSKSILKLRQQISPFLKHYFNKDELVLSFEPLNLKEYENLVYILNEEYPNCPKDFINQVLVPESLQLLIETKYGHLKEKEIISWIEEGHMPNFEMDIWNYEKSHDDRAANPIIYKDIRLYSNENITSILRHILDCDPFLINKEMNKLYSSRL